MKKLTFLFLILGLKTFSQNNYFQQEVNYTIDVKLNDKNHTLSAFEEFEYINNSPNELTEIYIHLWPNAYKNSETALGKQKLSSKNTRMYYAEDSELGYIDSLDFKVNGTKAAWSLDENHIDIAKITLTKPLKTGESVKISTPFKVKIPKGIFSRLGHMGQAYQVTQWYPKPAVYDKNGWNAMPYLNQGEFYSEYGRFDVKITLPKNYYVGSTGDLIDGEDEIAFLEKRIKETNEFLAEIDSLDKKGRKARKRDTVPTSSKEWKTLHYKQKNVHDFAWFADKTWYVQKGEVELLNSRRKVDTWVMFTDGEAHLWKKGIEYLNDAIFYYSKWNGDYPYNQMTAVDGALTAGGGMEYPNVTVIGRSQFDVMMEQVIMHETGHQWFYGILGTNERVHPWLDEGINSFNESRYFEEKYGEKCEFLGFKTDKKGIKFLDLHRPHKDMYYLMYNSAARENTDQPMELHAAKYTDGNYGNIVYMKSAVMLDYLKAYLGDEVFDKAMQQYFETWKFKHPQPEDLREVLETSTGKNLSWFFDGIVNTTDKIDFKIIKAKEENGKINVTIQNQGDVKSPIVVSAIKDGKAQETVWNENTEDRFTVEFPDGDYDSFVIDKTEEIPEIYRNNNILKAKGLLKKMEPLRFQPLFSIENHKKTQLFASPVVGWNNYDKIMLGASIYNPRIPTQKFDYAITPMWSFGGNQLNGIGAGYFNVYPQQIFQKIRFGAEVHSFSFNDVFKHQRFIKVNPNTTFEFKKRNPRSLMTNTIKVSHNQIYEYKYSFVDKSSRSDYLTIDYTFNNANVIFPNSVKLQFENGWYDNLGFGISSTISDYAIVKDNFSRISLKAKQTYKYNKWNDKLSAEIFVGKAINKSNSSRYNFRMDGIRGFNDYTYSEVFMGRNEFSGLWSNHFEQGMQGGLKVQTFVGQSSDWLSTLSLTADLPIKKFPLELFADFGFTRNEVAMITGNGTTSTITYSMENTFVYDAGFTFHLGAGASIFIPILVSDNIKESLELNTDYAQKSNIGKLLSRTRFTMNLTDLNPLKLTKNLGF
jgi:hypothetical protein